MPAKSLPSFSKIATKKIITMCIIQSSSEKQNEKDGIYTYICVCVYTHTYMTYFKELALVVWRLTSLKICSWKTDPGQPVIQFQSKGLQAYWLRRANIEFKGRKKPNVPAKAVRQEEFLLTHQKINLLFLSRSSTDKMGPTHIRMDNLLYSAC